MASKSGTVYKVIHDNSDKNWQGYGNGVVIDHGDGYYSHYAHMDNVCVLEGSYGKKQNRRAWIARFH